MENKKLKLQVEDLLQEIERFKTALVRSEQRVKEVSEIPCKECPLWRHKTDKLSGKFFNIIKGLKQELRDLKTDCRAKIDDSKRDIKD
jgi:hypothetical protein